MQDLNNSPLYEKATCTCHNKFLRYLCLCDKPSRIAVILYNNLASRNAIILEVVFDLSVDFFLHSLISRLQ